MLVKYVDNEYMSCITVHYFKINIIFERKISVSFGLCDIQLSSVEWKPRCISQMYFRNFHLIFPNFFF